MKIKQTVAAAMIGAAFLMAAGPAVATGSAYTVAVGGSSAPANHPFTASTVGSVSWKVPTLTMGCAGASVPASPPSTALSGTGVTDVLTVNKVAFAGCTMPLGALQVTTAGSWAFRGTTPAGPASNDSIVGHLDGFNATWSNAACRFTVSGKARASFDEANQKLVVDESGFTGNLTVSKVVGCVGQIRNGQPLDFSATFALASPDGDINLS